MSSHIANSVESNSLTTVHARVRCQQRGITHDMLDLLLEHGKERHLGRGATILSFPKQARENLRHRLSRQEFAFMSSHMDIYAVVGDSGMVMTVGHRYRPIREKH